MAKISPRSTKAQILKAYQDIEKEKKELENRVSKIQNELTQAHAEVEKAKKEQVKPVAEKTIVKVIGETPRLEKPEGILLTLEGISKGLSLAFSEVSSKLTIKADELSELNKQIEEKKLQMEKLYNMKFADDTLNKIIEEYESSGESFDEEMKKTRLNFDTEWEEALKTWEKEQKESELSLQ